VNYYQRKANAIRIIKKLLEAERYSLVEIKFYLEDQIQMGSYAIKYLNERVEANILIIDDLGVVKYSSAVGGGEA
jgi:hypothetical protein